MQPIPSLIRSRIGSRLVHPGEILLGEFMRPFSISQNALARCIGVSPRCINQIVNGKRAITASTALGLGEALGPSPHFWMALQADYDIERARARARATATATAPGATSLKARPRKPLPSDDEWVETIDEGEVNSTYDGRRHDWARIERRRVRRP